MDTFQTLMLLAGFLFLGFQLDKLSRRVAELAKQLNLFEYEIECLKTDDKNEGDESCPVMIDLSKFTKEELLELARLHPED